MNTTATRLYVVAAIIVGAYGVSRLLQIATEPPEAELPGWTFNEMPLQLGKWRGENTKLDPEIAAATGAATIVDRAYRDEQRIAVSLHTAVFEDPAIGINHSPLNCYRRNGWNKTDDTRENVEISQGSTLPVAMTAWEKEGEKVMVVYWYQLGEQVLYDRFELGSIRWKMRGQPKWPALIKVMIQIPVTDPDDSKALVLGFAEHVAKWLNQPAHKKYLGRWPNV
jgi:EpsI family protein